MPGKTYDQIASVYDAGRAVTLQGLEGWRAAVSRYLLPSAHAPVLDVGSGTGIFAHAFVEWFDARVVAVEPSEKMRTEAIRWRAHSHITYLAGDAEHIPLDDSSVSAAWLSTVIHHIPDLSSCAQELRRVLHAGAPVLIRSAFPGHLDAITLFRYFPAAKRVAERFPTIDATVDAFATAGFRVEALERVPQITAGTLSELYERVRLRADTTLQAIDDEEFQQGLDALERLARDESSPRPIADELTLVVLR